VRIRPRAAACRRLSTDPTEGFADYACPIRDLRDLDEFLHARQDRLRGRVRGGHAFKKRVAAPAWYLSVVRDNQPEPRMRWKKQPSRLCLAIAGRQEISTLAES